MRAAIARAYGPPDVVSIAEVPDPTPAAGQVLVRVTAAAVTRGDAPLRGLDVPLGFGPVVRPSFGLTRPRRAVLGMGFAGRVERAAGPFSAGTRVSGSTGMALSAHAERLVIPATGGIFPTAHRLSDDAAAAFFFGGTTAAHFLLAPGGLAVGERVLVTGATGEVVVAALQLAPHTGATVTAVCSAAYADFARQRGAGEVIDYRAGPVTGAWDVILDAAATLPWPIAEPLLAPGGRLIAITAGLPAMLGAILRPRRSKGRRIVAGVADDSRAAMERLIAQHAAGAYRPVVGTVLPFDRISEAHALAGSGHKRGAVVVRIDPD